MVGTWQMFGNYIRPGKVYSLFPMSHFLNFDASRWSLFIIRAVVTQPGAFHVNWTGPSEANLYCSGSTVDQVATFCKHGCHVI